MNRFARCWILLVALLAPAISARAKATESAPVGSHAQFDFRSEFWINLHHFLYEEAASDADAVRAKPHESLSPEDVAAATSLSPEEKKAWSTALAYYKANFAGRDLLSNDMMRNIKNRLEDSKDSERLSNPRLDPSLVSALNRAAPVYRAHWWPAHDRANHAWIDALTPVLLKDGKSLPADLSVAFGKPWPDSAIRVDVVAYANWAGAYTTLRPSRVTISSTDARNQGIAALEVLFHEASHTLIENVGDDLIRDFAAHKKTAPRDLWHALLFFTVGYYVHSSHPDYVPYAESNHLWDHGFSAPFKDALVADWQPHLEGKVALEPALAHLAADLAKQSQK